jgi:chaperonin GroES
LLPKKKRAEELLAAMAKRLIPSLNRVLVEKLLQPKKTAGGILLPETTKQVRAA